jgi:16S rRNA (guanine966-N2)-methyltransferase
VRIVAGTFRGRRIAAPAGDSTRPTTDRVREALFSSLSSLLGPDLGGGRVLDPFAGSGALGLEALSRGCASVTFVEDSAGAVATLKRNIDVLGAGRATQVIKGDSMALAGRGGLPGGPFSLILLDPPYRLDPSSVTDLLRSLAARDLLEEGCAVTWEHGTGTEPDWPQGFSARVHKKYGSTEVDIAVYAKGAGS